MRRSWEAVSRPGMRFVAINTEAQQDTQMLHRIRSRLVAERTALINQVRALGGIRHRLRPRDQARCAVAWRCCSPRKTPALRDGRELLADLNGQLRALDERIANYDARVKAACATESAARHRPADRHSAGRRGHRWQAIRQRPADGREPWAHATGAQQWGKQRLMGITKRGNPYAPSSSTGHAPYCAMPRARPTGSPVGLWPCKQGAGRMSRPWHWPTNSPGSTTHHLSIGTVQGRTPKAGSDPIQSWRRCAPTRVPFS